MKNKWNQHLKREIRMLALMLSVCFLVSICPLARAEQSLVTLYAPDGKTITVEYSEKESYKAAGWYEWPVTTMYAPDGRTFVIASSEVESYKAVGLSVLEKIKMYSPNGVQTVTIMPSEKEAYKAAGWYEWPVTTMYAPDGRTYVIATSEVDRYREVGLYNSLKEAQSPVTLQYVKNHITAYMSIPKVGAMNRDVIIVLENRSAYDVEITECIVNEKYLYAVFWSYVKSGYRNPARFETFESNYYGEYYPGFQIYIDQTNGKDPFTLYLDNNSVAYITIVIADRTFYAKTDVYGNTIWGVSLSSVRGY